VEEGLLDVVEGRREGGREGRMEGGRNIASSSRQGSTLQQQGREGRMKGKMEGGRNVPRVVLQNIPHAHAGHVLPLGGDPLLVTQAGGEIWLRKGVHSNLHIAAIFLHDLVLEHCGLEGWRGSVA
jgi:hypothetical protein